MTIHATIDKPVSVVEHESHPVIRAARFYTSNDMPYVKGIVFNHSWRTDGGLIDVRVIERGDGYVIVPGGRRYDVEMA